MKLVFGTIHRPLTDAPASVAPVGIMYQYAIAWLAWKGFGIKTAKPHGLYFHKSAILIRLWPMRRALYLEFGSA